ncbi:hypothetical protein CK203_061780 [Vitis vinifera]|uniref:Uncharacterized protein n=1 Tax=Vitis vinifera TaxID=29760 RepID=A0A438GB42_VITVI|nr:hypothetical protein CK203_061780 [Vitis vinifera]
MRQRASSTQVPSDSLSQAAEALRIPSSEGGEATGPSSPASQRRYETWRPPTTPGVTTSHPESLIRHPPAKGPGLQVPGSHLELLSLQQILSYLLTCHQSLLSDVRWSQHHPLRATQIVESDPSSLSYILIRRPCDSSLSSEIRTAYSRGTTLSTS